MTTQTDAGADADAPTMGGACHSMLLRLAGRVPDGLLTHAREWLAAHDPEKVARAVVSCAAMTGLTLAAEDAALLRWIFETAGLDLAVLDGIEVAEFGEFGESADVEPVEHAFAPAAPEVMARRGDEFGPCLDLAQHAATEAASGELIDDLDRGAVEAVSAVPGAVALWRAWRSPANGSPWPVPRRVFLLAMAEAGQTWPAAAALQDRLAALGEREPQVEVFTTDAALPAYQRTARAMSALLWTAAPCEPIRLAPVYDEGPEGSPFFAADRPRLPDIDRVVVTDLLNSGALVMSTTARLDDVLVPDGQGRGRVPVNFRTDGVWVWNDAIAYYVREHGIAPTAALLDHLRSGRPQSRPDAVAMFRATAALTRPEPAEG